MKYYDYDWDIQSDRILLDSEINIDKLGWKAGDYFKIANINGQAMLLKVDPVEAFAKGHRVNGAN